MTGFIQGGLNTDLSQRQKAASCLQLKLSGVTIYQTERSIQTDLSASGQIEVEEIVAALPCGQVHKSFICESVAVGKTQVLKVQTVPV